MAVEKYTVEETEKMSMIELANMVLTEEKKELNFADLFNKVAEMKNLSAAQREQVLAQFYTDLNVDGRFMTLGSNVWALRRWYPVDQTTEKSLAESRKREQEELEEELEDEEYFDEIDQLEYDEDED